MNRTQNIRYAPPILLVVLLGLAGLVYGWGIKLGYIHSFYGPAVYSMSHSWSAFFWGSWDGHSIALDKLPGSFWIQALSARIFGFNNWSVLLPGVFEALGCGWLMYLIVRRIAGPERPSSGWWGLAGAALTLVTPILSALSHTEISDTLYTFLTLCAVWAWLKSLNNEGKLRWLVLAGIFIGGAFHAKMAQAWGILPALALVYLFAVKIPWKRRILNLILTGVVTLFCSLFYIIVALLVPASHRPWIDGSTSNNAFITVFVYNLLGRYDDGETQAHVSGWRYLISPDQASQAGWFYFAALLGLIAVLWLYYKKQVSGTILASSVMAAIWVAVYWIAFSSGQVNHNYYVVILAPALVILSINGAMVSLRDHSWFGRIMLSLMAISTVGWAVYITGSYQNFQRWTIPATIVIGIIGIILLLASGFVRTRVLATVGAVIILLASVLSPAAWAVAASTREYSGNARGPVAGPVNGMSGMGGGGGSNRGGQGGQPGNHSSSDSNSTSTTTTHHRSGNTQGGAAQSSTQTTQPSGAPQGNQPGGSQPTGGGFGSVDTASATKNLEWIRANDPGSEYDLVVVGYSAASDYVLAGGNLIAVGGYSGKMDNYTLAQLQADIASGAVHYVLLGNSRGGGMGNATGSTDGETAATAISNWVQENCTSVADSSGISGLYRCA
ncbi:MAG: glycosyltransferase family 39 protein [Corynebacterium sp.]|nr:glycosyltransferase family 39 protein [Corynebacterium sp.]